MRTLEDRCEFRCRKNIPRLFRSKRCSMRLIPSNTVYIESFDALSPLPLLVSATGVATGPPRPRRTLGDLHSCLKSGSAGGVPTAHGREFEFGISTGSTQPTTTNQRMSKTHCTIHTLKPRVRSVGLESVLLD